MSKFLQHYINLALEASGLEDSSLKILLCALLSYPFSAIFKRLNDSNYTVKNVYIVSVTAFYVFGILNITSGLGALITSSLGSYFITRYFSRSSMPWINFIFLMCLLGYTHLRMQFFETYDASKIDLSGAQMVMVMKLSAFGWSIHDGRQPEETLNDFQRSRVIRKHPNLLPFIAYTFFYASFLTGPAFDYSDYDKFIHNALFDDVPVSKRPGKRGRRIPRSGRVAFRKFLFGVFWAFLLFQSSKYVQLNCVLSGSLAAEHGFVYRIFYYWVLGFSFRLKYYTIWLIAEGACILCGIGYNGYDATTDSFKWNRVENIDPLGFEFGQNVHTCLEAWNKNTNKWLKYYVYLRIARKGKKPGFKSTLFTFLSSAFWHGTHPGYYLTFLLGAFLQTLGKIYRRNLRPIFLEADGKTSKSSKKIYDLVCYLVTQLAFGYAVLPFVILDFKNSIYAWKVGYFYVHIATAITLLLFKGPYAKHVTGFLKSYYPQAEASRPVRGKLNEDEFRKVKLLADALKEKEYYDPQAPTLGLPSIEDLENIDSDEIDKELEQLSTVWSSFRNRRNSLTDEDLEGIKEAYNNFTTEIRDIISSNVNQDKSKNE